MEKIILKMQKSEITEYFIYKKLAEICKEPHNKEILLKISEDELRHYNTWKEITGKNLLANKFKVFFYVLLAKVFGLTFALKLMENGETFSQNIYNKISEKYPQAKIIEKDEKEHERKLINLLKDETLSYAGAIVLGLNDALVELTGTLAGLSFAFSQSHIIGVTGIILGISAALSMSTSGYLSAREDNNEETNPIKAAIYTGIAYILTVIVLVSPYFIFNNPKYSLILMLLFTLLIIASYNFYISVAKEVSFKRRFLEMAVISMSVAVISFVIGHSLKVIVGIDV